MKFSIRNFVMEKWEKFYVAGSMVAVTLLTSQPAFAATDTSLDIGCTATKSWNVPAPIVTFKNLIADPVKWIQIASGIALPFVLLMIFLKFKGAKGRQEKIEEAYKLLYWSLGIDILIFSVTWASSFVMGKIC